MRHSVRTFVADVAEHLPVEGPVLEIGARPAAGQETDSDLRALFAGHDYIGLDIQPGVNVDVVGDIHRLGIPSESIGTVVCVEVLEHVHDPLRAVQEIHRILRPGGIGVFTSVMFMPVHAHPWDFWRFTPEGLALVLEPFETSVAFGYGMDILPEGVQGVGVKGPCPGLSPESFPATYELCRQWGEHLHVDFGPIRFTVRQLWRRTLLETSRAIRRRIRG